MKIRQDQLSQHLSRGLASCYLVSGDDPLLVMEACDEIRLAVKNQGINERELFHAEAGFEWRSLFEEASAMSLFSSQRLLEVRIPNGKPSDKGSVLKELAENPSPDNILLIICPRLDSKTQKTAWYKAIEKQGIVLPIWPIERNQYAGWLKRRLQIAGLTASQDALAALVQHTEGNLLAAVQEIEKLRLVGISDLTLEIVDEAIGDSARFDAFTLADACLAGQQADAVRMLSHLKAEGTEPLSMLGAITRKIRQLIALYGTMGKDQADAFRSQGIWPKQQPLYKKSLSRMSLSQLQSLLEQAYRVDAAVKGDGNDAWLIMSELVVAFTQPKKPA